MSSDLIEYNAKMHTIDESSSTADLLTAYVGCVERLREAVAGMDRDALRARPVEGKWSTLEVVCHLTDTDIYFTDRIERTVALDHPLLLGVDERPYPERLQFQEQDVDEELLLMEVLRKRTARILRRQDASVWTRTAVHSEAGLITLRQLVTKCVRHVDHHLPFIAQKRAALRSTAGKEPRSLPTFQTTVVWEQPSNQFVAGKYSRSHRWIFDGGISVDASPSPHVVPAPWSVEAAIDPEEALVASASSCHMLTFLWLASKAGWSIDRYEDQAIGKMSKNADRVAWVSEILLQPTIGWTGGHSPTADEVARLHHAAHQQCFIANSIKSRVTIASLPLA
jgi:organic hydroperoxide reductase OsmC/OhrA/uncharacterized damage-inducible protein DinB